MSIHFLHARATGRGDCERTVAALRADVEALGRAASVYERRLDEALEELGEAGEALAAALARNAELADDLRHWCERATAAELDARRAREELAAFKRRPSQAAALYALVAMGWQDFFGLFETAESRAGVQR